MAEGALDTLSPAIPETVKHIEHYLVEDIRSARRFLGSLKVGLDIRSLNFYVLDKKTPMSKVEEYFKAIPNRAKVGVISEAGCPGVADPGARAVEYAHRHEIEVIPLVGPSSILLALMASGFNGQNFAFEGYLPVKKPERIKAIKSLESQSKRFGRTQIFMETPYRNNHMLEDLVQQCQPETKLCVACDITGEGQYIRTMTINQWKRAYKRIDLHKKPVMFVLFAQ
ncbi:SAM-dependent methyltransferase [Algivirga pacifica]|uniref:SAM-dependent methyltransferase n=2 Tax=Algivirga pacifica TaxID=1162670 RepID=A0ABP9DG19_9BACT